MEEASEQYRNLIDALVRSCRDGQGQVAAKRVLEGVWSPNAEDPDADMPDQRAMNGLLRRLAPADREILAQMMAEEFVSGVHESLVVLHEQKLPPFDNGYEGTPFHDFVGRLDAWEWPAD